MGKGTRTMARALAVAALGLCLAACSAADFMNPVPTNRVGTEVDMRANERQQTSRPQVEPEYIPRAEELVGVDEATARRYFGEPSLLRVDQGSQIWQYGAETCVLFLFLYPDTDDISRISYVTSSGVEAGVPTPGDQACIDAVTRMAANAGPMG
jgi:hypothetical protein